MSLILSEQATCTNYITLKALFYRGGNGCKLTKREWFGRKKKRKNKTKSKKVNDRLEKREIGWKREEYKGSSGRHNKVRMDERKWLEEFTLPSSSDKVWWQSFSAPAFHPVLSIRIYRKHKIPCKKYGAFLKPCHAYRDSTPYLPWCIRKHICHYEQWWLKGFWSFQRLLRHCPEKPTKCS